MLRSFIAFIFMFSLPVLARAVPCIRGGVGVEGLRRKLLVQGRHLRVMERTSASRVSCSFQIPWPQENIFDDVSHIKETALHLRIGILLLRSYTSSCGGSVRLRQFVAHLQEYYMRINMMVACQGSTQSQTSFINSKTFPSSCIVFIHDYILALLRHYSPRPRVARSSTRRRRHKGLLLYKRHIGRCDVTLDGVT
ncbi:uncharacterized protein LOC113474734 [Ciona intestinalis]